MIPSQSSGDGLEARRQASTPTGYEKRPQGIEKQRQPIVARKSAYLKQIQSLAVQTASRDSRIQLPCSLPASHCISSDKISQDTPASSWGLSSGRKRKRSQRDIDDISQAQDGISTPDPENRGRRRQVIKPIRSPRPAGTGVAVLQQGTHDPEIKPGSRIPKQTRVPVSSSAGNKSLRDSPIPENSSNCDREREDAIGVGDSLRPLSKFSQGYHPPVLTSSTDKDRSGQEVLEKPSERNDDRIDHWVWTLRWPKRDFDRDSRISAGAGQDGWFGRIKEKERLEEDPAQMGCLLVRKKSAASLRQNAYDAGSVPPSSTTPGDEKPRELKSAPYRQAGYVTLLETQGSFLRESTLGIDDQSEGDCQTLLEREQPVPSGSLFRDDAFSKTMEAIKGRTEARVIKDLTPLIVPSAEDLATLGHKHLDILVENVNEGWNESIPLTIPRPQPDYSVGFRRSAFTDGQLKKLQPYIGAIFFGGKIDTSFFVATWRCYFPFLSCEVKSGAGGIEVADRQNAHSMTLAVRGVVELLRLVGRERELHRQILAFSVSHDDKNVRIYGHYPMIDDEKTSFYRHPIREFVITDQAGKEKWTAYKFIRNVYEVFMPKHHKRICNAIDAIKLQKVGASAAEPFQRSLPAYIPHIGNDSSQETTADSTPTQGSFKKPRFPPKVMLQQEIERLKEQLKQRDDQHKQQMDYLVEQLKQRDDQHKQQMDQQQQQMNRLIDLLQRHGLQQSGRQSLHELDPGVSQRLDAPLSQQSNAESVSALAGGMSLVSSQTTTANTSFTQI
ncbi:MAG: hypothetical protein M1816_000438 [Peltula sp. TS41687]|nr:MAG: hypothetical protein M1816_000438 [Peltula sp. TS41687]